jgi:hypothetical protein
MTDARTPDDPPRCQRCAAERARTRLLARAIRLGLSVMVRALRETDS